LALIAGAPVQAAVLDIDLAGEPSYPVCQALSDRGVPFLFLSAYTSPDALIPAAFRDAPRLTKPFEPDEFRVALETLIRTSPAASDAPTFGNTIVDGLPADLRRLIAPSLESVPLRAGERLTEPGAPSRHVYFPTEGLISVFAGTTPGTRIEVAAVGNSGMTAPGILLGDATSSHAVVQASGHAWRIPVGTMRQLVDLHPGLRRYLLDRVGMALRQIMETASYGGRATVVERVARWLVQATQQLGSRQVVITHDALSEILGVRRPSVTTALHVLEGQRLLRSTRRAITVIDVDALRAVAER
jgi:CRP-like cAMP-binding protein